MQRSLVLESVKSMVPGRIAGIVLAGGRSTRFGQEKAIFELKGRPMMLWTHARLRERTNFVAISAPPGSGAAAIALREGIPVLSDRPGAPDGPLAGIEAAMAWALELGAGWLFSLACDTPFISAHVLYRLENESGLQSGAFALTTRGSEGLCALWDVAALPLLSSLLIEGRHPSVRSVLDILGAKRVFFKDDAAFRNINCLDDLDGANQ